MQRWRHLANDEIQSSDAATYSIDLPTSGNLHALLVEVMCTNGATSGRAVSIMDACDRIRVVGDGDERYFDLIPEEIEKWYETLFGKGLYIEQNEGASAVQRGLFPVFFGREISDKEFFLPLSTIKNPRLEVLYSPTIAADGGFATGTFTVNVMALWSPSQENLQYRGTIVTRTIANFTSVASGDNTTDIDILDPIRAIGVYAYESAVEDGTNITQVRLEANAGEFDIFNGDWRDFLNVSRLRFGSRVVHNIRAFLQDTDTLLTRCGDIVGLSVAVHEDVNITADTFVLARVDTTTGDQLTFNVSLGDVTAGAEDLTAHATDTDLLVTVEGNSPSYFGVIPFMKPDEQAGYLNPQSLSKLRLILTQGNAGAEVRNSVQYLKMI